jgi:hypothetical protein
VSHRFLLPARWRRCALALCLALSCTSQLQAAEPASQVAQADAADHDFVLELLLDRDPHVALFGAKALGRGHASPDDLDVVAELLAERARAPQATPVDLDITAWLMNALGASGDARYRATIESTVAAYANPKVGKYGTQALGKLPAADAAAYAPGSVSLDAVRARIAARRASQHGDGADLFTIAPGTPVEALIDKLGPPDARVESINSKTYVYARISTRALDLVYFGRGIVSLDNRGGEGWVVTETWPEIQHALPAYRGAHPVDAALVMSSDTSTVAALSDRLLERKETEPELLDRVMERLSKSARPRDEAEALAMRNFCRLLGRSGLTRYHDPLRRVAQAAGEGDLRELALAASAKLD